MAGLVFYYQDSDIDVWSGHNLDAWNYAASAAGSIDKMIVINQTDQVVNTPNASLEFRLVEEMPVLEGHKTLVVCPWEIAPKVSLANFDHDTDWYVFGPAQGWGNPLPSADAYLTIPQAGQGACHSVHVATAIMYDRYSKWQ
jgi:hypothetical protein